jgi:phenylacetate-CoA ligase
MDQLTVRVEARAETSPERRIAAARELRAAVKDGVGVHVEVTVLDPDTLQRSVGKLQRVLDHRDES